ncbi:hypothetical protein ACEWY4_002110 [Coilia grayii]|uniref:C2H2-type domain-containing protein n=1 Tax=Coilia grayii TaxID=363190 RepID=A0ABD1KUW2_9TELE
MTCDDFLEGCKPPPVVFACSKCPFQDGSGVNLDQHLMKNHPDDFSRLHSAKTFTRGADNKPKTTSHNDKRTRELDNSNAECKSLTRVGEASTDHTGSETVNPRVCSVSSQILPCPLDMERHMGSHSMEKTQEELYLPAKETDKHPRDTFQNQKPIQLGVETNLKRDDVRSKVCPTCGKTFTRPYDMRRHQKRHSRPVSMRTHLKRHTDLRFESSKGSEASTDHTASETVDPRVCSVPGRSLPCPLDMERHMGSHSMEKTHEELYLPEKETDKQSRDTFQNQTPKKLGVDTNLKRDDVRSKVCPTCGKTFTRPYDMRRHQKRHSRPFSMQTHLKRHTDLRFESSKGSEASTDHPASETVDPRVCSVPGQSLSCPLDMEGHMGSHSTKKTHEELYLPEKETDKHPRDTFQNQKPIKLGVDTNLKRDDVRSKVCPTCGKTFTRPYDMRRHQKRHSRLFSMRTHLKHHIDLRFESSNLTRDDLRSKVCPICGNTFTRATSMRAHLKRHTNLRFKSSNGSETFPHSSDLEKQKQDSCTEPTEEKQAVVSLEEPLVCNTCGKKFCFITHYERHMNEHYRANRPPEQWRKCDKCEEIFRTVSDLNKHHRCHWGDDPLQCAQCGRRFKRSILLASHRQIHSQCTMCDGKFTDITSFCLHYLEVHNIKGPYSCSHCHKKFTKVCPLVLHLSKHTGGQPYQCPQCPKRFMTAPRLTAHKRTHRDGSSDTRERSHLCHVCGKCFYTKNMLKVHERTHLSREHMCTVCGKGFKEERAGLA